MELKEKVIKCSAIGGTLGYIGACLLNNNYTEGLDTIYKDLITGGTTLLGIGLGGIGAATEDMARELYMISKISDPD